MEQPQPSPEDQRIIDPERAHDIGNVANNIIDETLAGREVSSEHRHDVVSLATNMGELSDELRSAKRAAETDGLTGLANQESFNKALPTAEGDPSVVVVAFDGDNFGEVNKHHNQDAGDAVIIAMAKAIREAANSMGNNRVFRAGGDEFYVLCDAQIGPAIVEAAQRIFREELAGKEALPDARGNLHPAEWFRTVGITGASAKTRVEADGLVQEQKLQRRSS